RLPTIRPNVIPRELPLFMKLISFSRTKPDRIEGAQHGQQRSPPDIGVKVGAHHGMLRRRNEQPGPYNQQPIDEQQSADEKPDREHSGTMHSATRKSPAK